MQKRDKGYYGNLSSEHGAKHNSEPRVQRIMFVFSLLIANRMPVSISDLNTKLKDESQNKYDISERSLRRDLEILECCGYPIIRDKGMVYLDFDRRDKKQYEKALPSMTSSAGKGKKEQFLEELKNGLIEFYDSGLHLKLLEKRLDELSDKREYQQALNLVKTLRESAPADFSLALKELVLCGKTGDYAKSEEICRNILELCPNSPDREFPNAAANAVLAAVNILEQAGQAEQAKELFLSSFKYASEKEKNNDRQIKYAYKSIKRIIIFYRFVTLERHGRLEEALELCSIPGAEDILLRNKVSLLEKLGRKEEAFSIACLPENILKLAEYRLKSLFSKGLYEEALSDCDKILSLRNKKNDTILPRPDFTAKNMKAKILARLERYEELSEFIKNTYPEPYSKNNSIFLEREAFLSRARANNPEKALEFFSRPENGDMFLASRIKLLDRLGRTEEALSECNKAISEENGSPLMYFTDIKKILMEKLGRKDEIIAMEHDNAENSGRTDLKHRHTIETAINLADKGKFRQAEKQISEAEKEMKKIYDKREQSEAFFHTIDAKAKILLMQNKGAEAAELVESNMESLKKCSRNSAYKLLYIVLKSGCQLDAFIERIKENPEKKGYVLLNMAEILADLPANKCDYSLYSEKSVIYCEWNHIEKFAGCEDAIYLASQAMKIWPYSSDPFYKTAEHIIYELQKLKASQLAKQLSKR